MKNGFILIVALLMTLGATGKGDKQAQKNRRAIEKEEKQFEKNLRKSADTAQTFLQHANNLAAMQTEFTRAGAFYKLALQHDSTKANIYKDYGIYLTDKMHAYTDARPTLEKGLSLAPGDDELIKHLVSVSKILELQEADRKLREFGTTSVREIGGAGCRSVSCFDSLKNVTATVGSPYNFQSLEARYMADDVQLTPGEMYILIIGYASQPSYNPFNYNDITAVKMLAAYNLDSAISKGKELAQTNPLNPTLNRELMYYYRKKGDKTDADRYQERIRRFFSGVLYSGNGSCEQPYLALWSKEEYNFLTYLGYQSNGSHYMGTCAGQMAEIIDATDPKSHKTEPVCFNVALIYLQAVGKQ